MTQSCLAAIQGRRSAGALLYIVFACLTGCAAAIDPGAAAGISGRGSTADAWEGAPQRPGWAPYPRLPETGDWFEVYRITPRVFAIYEPGQFEEVISYLIVGDERAVLFDTGLGLGDIAALTGRLTNRPVTVVNSHAHYDHIGGNHAFDDIRAHRTPLSTSRPAGADNAAVRRYAADAWLARPLPAGVSADTYRIRPYAVPTPLADGQRIELGGLTLDVLLTPGHTADSLCLVDRADGILFTGDTFYPAPLYTHLDGAGLAAYQASAERLAALVPDIGLILPGHNEPVADPAVLRRVAVAFADIRAGQAPDATADGLNEYHFDGFSVLVRPADLVAE